MTFPDALRTLFTHADGQPDDAPTVSDAFRLMLLADAVEAALFLDDFFPRGSNNENPGHDPIAADSGVRAVCWRKSWIPVFANGGGDYYCVDTDLAALRARSSPTGEKKAAAAASHRASPPCSQR